MKLLACDSVDAITELPLLSAAVCHGEEPIAITTAAKSPKYAQLSERLLRSLFKSGLKLAIHSANVRDPDARRFQRKVAKSQSAVFQTVASSMLLSTFFTLSQLS